MEPEGSLLHSQVPTTCHYQGNNLLYNKFISNNYAWFENYQNTITTIKDIYLLLIWYV